MATLSVLITAFWLLPILSISFSSENPTDRLVLVLLDEFSLKSSHSIFFNSIYFSGLELDFKLADDPKLSTVLCSVELNLAGLGGSLDVNSFLDFVESGHDLILAADESTSDLIRSIVTEFRVDFDEDSSAMIIDHKNYAISKTEGDHTLIASEDFIQSDVILGSSKIEVLKVPSFNIAPSCQEPHRLLDLPSRWFQFCRLFRSGVQKAGNSNKYNKPSNEQFVSELSKWFFHERGHLKVVHRYEFNSIVFTLTQRLKLLDQEEFSIEIYEWSGKSWERYVANNVQIQFYMMSPYVLKTLSNY